MALDEYIESMAFATRQGDSIIRSYVNNNPMPYSIEFWRTLMRVEGWKDIRVAWVEIKTISVLNEALMLREEELYAECHTIS